jgi:hypothetical protein
MKNFIIILLSFVLITSVTAATIKVDERVNDLYFANGIKNTEDDAKFSLYYKLQPSVKKDIYNNDEDAMSREVDFGLLYNQTHGIFFDLLEAFDQKKADHKYFWFVGDFVLDMVTDAVCGGITSIDVIKSIVGKGLDEIEDAPQVAWFQPENLYTKA